MISAAFAQKLGMTHVYDDKNRHVPVTILKLPEQVVTQLRTAETDDTTAVQIGARISKHVAKPQAEELKKNGIEVTVSKRKEISVDSLDDTSVGQVINATAFSAGDKLAVTGTDKGKGFAGGIKKHGWSRGPVSHGSKNVRQPGSIGSGYPQRVVPGKKLPGHLGTDTITTYSHKVVAINDKDNTVAITGTVPGANKSYVFIRKVS